MIMNETSSTVIDPGSKNHHHNNNDNNNMHHHHKNGTSSNNMEGVRRLSSEGDIGRPIMMPAATINKTSSNNNWKHHEVVNDSSAIIQRLLDKIESLESELARVKQERDALSSENERLCFQLQMINEADKHQRLNAVAAATAVYPPTIGVVAGRKSINNGGRSASVVCCPEPNCVQCNATIFGRSISIANDPSVMVMDRRGSSACSTSSSGASKTGTMTTVATDHQQESHSNHTHQQMTMAHGNDKASCCATAAPHLMLANNNNGSQGLSQTITLIGDHHYHHPLVDMRVPPPHSPPILERSISHHSGFSQRSSVLKLSPTSPGPAGGPFFASSPPPASSSNLVRQTRITGGSTSSLASNCNVAAAAATSITNYEISQQLMDKKVSALERKYGGAGAREAAIKIQRAYRSYRLQKRFTSLAIQAIQIKHQKGLQLQQENQQTPGSMNYPLEDVQDSSVAMVTNHQQQQYYYSDDAIPATYITPGNKTHHHHHMPPFDSGGQYSQLPPSIIYTTSIGGGAGAGSDGKRNLQKKTSFSSTSSTGSSSSIHGSGAGLSSKPSVNSKISSCPVIGYDNHQHHQQHSHSSANLVNTQPMTMATGTNNVNTKQYDRITKQRSQSQSSVVGANKPTNMIAHCPASGTVLVSTPNSVQFVHGATLAVATESMISQAQDNQRKRLYRVGLNLFNKTPSERGIRFLIQNGFIEQYNTMEDQAKAVAIFLLTRKGVSRQMIGEYLSENNPFNKAVLKAFSGEINLQGLIVDEALRSFQMNFRFPGEAQKIERIVESFADRYKECNPSDVLSRDSVFILAFAIIMLNTDLHKPTNFKHRMTQEQWLTNLKGVFSEGDLAPHFLIGIYKRIKKQELQTGPDHVTQVLKVQSTIVGKDVPNLCLPHRRLVCYCRLYEIRDINRKEKVGQHQRDVFLFNDLLLITKTTNRSRNNQLAEYQYRSSTSLDGLQVTMFSQGFYAHVIQISRRVDGKCIALFNARNELDQKRFVEDLRESIAEMDAMEQIRITKSSSLVQLNNFSSSNTNNNSTVPNDPQGGSGTVIQLPKSSTISTSNTNHSIANITDEIHSYSSSMSSINNSPASTMVNQNNNQSLSNNQQQNQTNNSSSTASNATGHQHSK